MNRREVLAAFAAAPLGWHQGETRASAASPVDLIHCDAVRSSPVSTSSGRTAMGVNLYSFAYRRPKVAYEFLEYCHSLGAAGVQTELDSSDPAYLRKLRQRAEELGMYLEIISSLPGEDATRFEQTVRAAQETGALCLRSACLSGRRYETFSGLDEWKSFVSDSKARIGRALAVLERYRMPLGLENHKDWTAQELVALLKEHSSEYLGVCLDTGNNIALLDDPYEVIESLAPYAVCTHIKDMAVEEYADGFLLSEVPLGDGMLEMKRVAATILRARPKTRFTLEMITRNPLKVPCLTEKYWITFPDRSGMYLARTLSMVRAHRPRMPLPSPDGLDRNARLRTEEDNVKRCLEYARDNLGLRTPRG